MRRLFFAWFRRLSKTFAGRGLHLHRLPGFDFLYTKLYAAVRPAGVVIAEVHGFKLAYDTELASPLYSLVAVGTYEQLETGIFSSFVKDGMVVVDAGANVGYYTLLAAKLVGPAGKVFAFEPDPRNFRLLQQSLSLNGYSQVTAVQKALADHAGSLTLYTDQINSSNSSLAKLNISEVAGSYQVEMITLDEFLQSFHVGNRIDFLKMDVQGAEGLVLAGAARTLLNRSLRIMLEFHPQMLRAMGSEPRDLLERLIGDGFKAQLIDHSHPGRLSTVDPEAILATCERVGYVNLLLQKEVALASVAAG